MEKPLTSLLTIFKSPKSGMTLLEVLLVFSMMALVLGLFAPGMLRVFRVSAHSAVKNFGTLVKYAYDQSVFTGRPHRIVIDLDQQTWSLEQGQSGSLPLQDASRELGNVDDSQDQTNQQDFQVVQNRYVPKLPTGIQIVNFESWRFPGSDRQPIDEGKVSIFVFPNGYVDDAILRFAERGKADLQHFVIQIRPLTGRIQYETQVP